jgi:hypothetical protein
MAQEIASDGLKGVSGDFASEDQGPKSGEDIAGIAAHGSSDLAEEHSALHGQ